MKAWIVRDATQDYSGSTVVFAESRGKAIYIALKYCDQFDGASFIDMKVTRFKEFDDHYRGNPEIDWHNPTDRIPLVRDYNWRCFEISDLCENCEAKQWCWNYEDLDDMREEHGEF